MRVKFITTCALAPKIYISPAYWMIRTYYELRGHNTDSVTWLRPVHDSRLSVEQILETVIAEQVDVLCLSMFIWNRAQLTQLAQLAKQRNPSIIVVAGGPDLDANKNVNFFAENPFIDYVVYGDGEEAFAILLDSLVTNTPIENGCNIVTPTKTWPFKLFADADFAQLSPWMAHSDDVRQTVNEFGADNCVLFYEVARGCPYKCSFCDWNNGLHNKVKRRRSDWKAEIDFFAELGVEVRVIDANWGMFKEDVEIHKYAAERLTFHAFNLPKMNKKVAYDIMSFSYEHFPNELYRVSLQDINELVLKNIDRPSPPWPEHKKLLIELKQKHPGIRLGAELIIGLPGQTVDSYNEMLAELDETGINEVFENFWMMLPNSPAYSPDYQTKFEIKHDSLVYLINNFNTFEELQNAIDKGLPGWAMTRTVTGSYSADFSDILTMYALSICYNVIKRQIKNAKWRVIGKRLLPKIKEFCNDQAKQIQETKIFAIPFDNKIFGFQQYFSELPNIKKYM